MGFIEFRGFEWPLLFILKLSLLRKEHPSSFQVCIDVPRRIGLCISSLLFTTSQGELTLGRGERRSLSISLSSSVLFCSIFIRVESFKNSRASTANCGSCRSFFWSEFL